MKLFVALIAVFLAAAPAAAKSKVAFHFYGAEDCPPCMAFKRNHLAGMRELGREAGFTVVENVIARTIDVAKVGSYGRRDATLRKAADRLDSVYPPIFIVTKNGAVVSAHVYDWRAARDAAVRAARSGS